MSSKGRGLSDCREQQCREAGGGPPEEGSLHWPRLEQKLEGNQDQRGGHGQPNPGGAVGPRVHSCGVPATG